MVSALSFAPPNPASYRIETDPSDPDKGSLLYVHEMLAQSDLYQQAAASTEIHFALPRKGHTRLPAAWLRWHHEQGLGRFDLPALPRSNLVLLHCHGNASDLGLMMGTYFELSCVLGVDVVGVEYTAYGGTGGEVRTKNLYEDVDAAYELLVRSGVSPSRIVAYGQSIGSAPACYLASKRPLAGLVLHSPLASALKVIDPRPDGCCRPSCAICCFDAFQNERMIKSVHCPVLIMHGRADEIVPWRNAQQVQQACQPKARWTPYYPAEAGHNNLVETDPKTYFKHLTSFLSEVNRRQQQQGEDNTAAGNGTGTGTGNAQSPPSQVRMSSPSNGSGSGIAMTAPKAGGGGGGQT